MFWDTLFFSSCLWGWHADGVDKSYKWQYLAGFHKYDPEDSTKKIASPDDGHTPAHITIIMSMYHDVCSVIRCEQKRRRLP